MVQPVLQSYDFWGLILTMLVAGLIGGVVSFYYTTPAKGQTNSLARSVVVGIGASLLVPVFLYLIQSQILDDIVAPVRQNVAGKGDVSREDKIKAYIVFFSFCLLAAISAFRFIASVSNSVLAELKEVKQQTDENRETLRALKELQKQQSVKRPARSVRETGRQEQGPLLSRPMTAGPANDVGRTENTSDKVSNYQLSATVRAVDRDEDLFRVILQVSTTDAAAQSLTGVVSFHLPDIFYPQVRQVTVRQGKATLELIAWRAFTVLAETADGVKLELNLADIPDVPASFQA